MVRQGVGVLIAVLALAGCGGGSSDEEKVVAAAKQLKSAAQRHDGRTLCREVLHPNTVSAVQRLASAQAAPGSPPPSCEQKFAATGPQAGALDGKAPTPDDVTISGDVAYLPDRSGAKRPLARRDGDTWKIDFTADPAIGWAMRASFACARWQDTLRAMPLPTASRQGIVADLRSEVAAMTAFRRELDAAAATGEVKAPAAALAAVLDRMTARLQGVAAALRRGDALDDTTKKVSKAAREDALGIVRAAAAASVQCGRIAAVAPDGAAFRRQANALCTAVAKDLSGLADPGSDLAAATRYLRRAGLREARASYELAYLKPPRDLARIYTDTIWTVQRLGATLRAEGRAVARHDLAATRRAVARLGTLDYRKSAGFNRLGLAVCAQL